MLQRTSDTRFEPPPDDRRFAPPDEEAEQRASRRRRLTLVSALLSLLGFAAVAWVRSSPVRGWVALVAALVMFAGAVAQFMVRHAVATDPDDKGPYSEPPSITR